MYIQLFRSALVAGILFFGFSIVAFNADNLRSRKSLPSEIIRDLEILMVNRMGSLEDSHMQTLDIFQSITPRTSYQVTLRGFIETTEISIPFAYPSKLSMPNHVLLEGKWLKETTSCASDANILGEFGVFSVNFETLNIPVSADLQNDLAYYGARLVKAGDVISFESDASLPVSVMNIGKNYAHDYLMNESFGGGFYLEFHDRPHFHMPLDENASGYLVLGKKTEEGLYQLTAFSIPFGHAVYTPGNIIHDDGLLVGNYMVVYSVTKEFQTVLLKGPKKAPVKVVVERLQE